MMYIKADNFADLYKKSLVNLWFQPDFVSSPRGMKVKESLNVFLELTDPTSTLFKCNDKKLTMPTGYTKREIALYLHATDSADLFTRAAPFWGTIQTPNGTVNSAYGNLIFNPSLEDTRSQFDWAFDSLKNDRDSRQAFMRYNNTSHQYDGNKDVPCTFIQMFHIRNNKLYSTVQMRSNDITTGTIHDISAFCLFMNLMFLRLKEVYHDLELGSYTHIANSFHLYEKDFDLAKSRLNAELIPNKFEMPKNWRCIKSQDVSTLVDIKVNKQSHLFTDWQYPENRDFYDWILS